MNDNDDNDKKEKLSKKLDHCSRKLVKLLRHKLIDINIIPDSEGYVLLDTLLNSDKELFSLTLNDVKLIVELDNKQRLSLRNENNIWSIRANQGHSKNVGNFINPDTAMRLIVEPIENVFHGTYKEYEEAIKISGLLPMSRTHIHVAKSLTAKSGKRNNCTLLIYIDMTAAMEDDIKFYESENGVILTEGPLLPKYLRFEDVEK